MQLTVHASPETVPCVGVVLAGGESRRMGRDKALLDWHGRPLLEHQTARLRQAGANDVKISGARPGYGGVADSRPQAGPLAGLAGVGEALTGEMDLLVIPVDMPLLQAELLRRLRKDCPGTACLRFAARTLPMRIRLNRRSRGVLATLLQASEPRQRSLRTLQEALGSEEIPLRPGEAEQFTDCNTPEAWNRVAQ